MRITERGWPGHYICSDRCVFHRNTLLSHKGKNIIISTVGRSKSKSGGLPDTIGYNRYYETRVFEGKKYKGYIDLAVEKEIAIPNIQCAIKEINWESDLLANNMHEEAIKKVKQLLREGVI